MKFSTKLILLFISITFIMTVTISTMVYFYSTHTLKKQITRNLEDDTYRIMDTIDRTLFERFSDIYAIATDPVIRSRTSSPQQITERLLEYGNIYKTYVSLSFFNQGKTRIADTAGLSLGENNTSIIFWNALAGNEKFVMDIGKSVTLEQIVFRFGAVVKDMDGSPKGYVVSQMPIEKIYDIIRYSLIADSTGKDDFTNIDLLDQQGFLIYSNHDKKGLLERAPDKYKLIQQAVSNTTKTCVTMEDEDMINIIVRENGYLDFKGHGWTLLLQVPKEKIFYPAVQLRNQIIMISCVATVFFLIIIRFFSHSFSRPLAKLRDTAREIGRGNLDVEFDFFSNDEIGQLSGSLKKMVYDLRISRDENLAAKQKLEEWSNVLEKRVEERTRELNYVNQELNDFAYVVSHDLKAPLRAIGSLASWIAEDYGDKLDQEGREYIALLTNRTKRMHNLIEGILQYSRIGRMAEEKDTVDLGKVVQNVIDMLAPPENILITIEDPLPVVCCERIRIEQVFLNLIANSIKHMDKPEGRIMIRCLEDSDYWNFSITDNGAGIEEKYFKKIFQIFQTLKTKDESESTGIGLSIVKKTIELYGGKIWLESIIGEGTTFFFTLPRCKPEPSHAQQAVP